MKAAVFESVGQPLRIETVADPTPEHGQAILKVGRCGICGSDLHLTDGKGFTPPAGSVLGHEYAGEVVAVGPGTDRLKLGDRVSAMPISGCGACAACLAGEPTWCVKGMRYFAGGYAEYALAGQNECVLLPSSLSMADGALVEPLAVALHGVRPVPNLPGARILVMGAGPIGLGVVFWARRFGAGRIEVIEGNPARQELALQMGANACRPPVAVDATAPTPDANAGFRDAPEIVFECVGRPGLLADAIAITRPRGTIVSLGFCMAPEQIVAAAATSKELTLKFPVLYSLREFEITADALDSGALEARAMITDTVTFDRLPGTFESLRKPGHHCKVMINPWYG